MEKDRGNAYEIALEALNKAFDKPKTTTSTATYASSDTLVDDGNPQSSHAPLPTKSRLGKTTKYFYY